MSLRTKVIRLAFKNPELRADLLPLVKADTKQATKKVANKKLYINMLKKNIGYEDNPRYLSLQINKNITELLFSKFISKAVKDFGTALAVVDSGSEVPLEAVREKGVVLGGDGSWAKMELRFKGSKPHKLQMNGWKKSNNSLSRGVCFLYEPQYYYFPKANVAFIFQKDEGGAKAAIKAAKEMGIREKGKETGQLPKDTTVYVTPGTVISVQPPEQMFSWKTLESLPDAFLGEMLEMLDPDYRDSLKGTEAKIKEIEAQIKVIKKKRDELWDAVSFMEDVNLPSFPQESAAYSAQADFLEAGRDGLEHFHIAIAKLEAELASFQ